MADIPGLIEGAAAGVGLGHDFLRHISRAGILVHLVEPEPADGTDPLENYQVIRHELEQYSVDLAQRPEIVVVSKAELPCASDVQQQLCEQTESDVLLISSVTGAGLDKLIYRIAAQLNSSERK